MEVDPPALEQHPLPEAEEDSLKSLSARRTRRRIQLPARFRDVVASPLPELPPEGHGLVSEEPSSSSTGLARESHARRIVNSSKNLFGLFRRYFGNRPDHDPEELVDLAGLTEVPTKSVVESDHEAISNSQPPDPTQNFYPFPNESSFKLGDWWISDGPQKSISSLNNLVKIVGHDDFKPSDVQNIQWGKGFKLLGANDFDGDRLRESNPLQGVDEDASWKKSPIHIQVPFHSREKNPGPKDFHVGDLYHRSLVEVIKEKLANTGDDQHFHYQPYELYWEPLPDMETPIRVHGELYTSPAFVEAHNALQEAPGEPGCSLPRVIAALMFDSDATHLTTSGDAKLWPCYLWFGNESKYRRSKPTHHLCNHVAYFQTLPDNFKDFAAEHCGPRGPSKKLFTHCRRETLHAQWEILLDDDFVAAYQHGIVVECCDGIKRRFYPRIFTYSADYQEKVIISSIRDKGRCPCPQCLILFTDIDCLGTPEDMQRRTELARLDDEEKQRRVKTARDYILKKNLAISSKYVEQQLQDISLTPTDNAFSKRLAPLGLGFNIYLALVVDLMHEFELGVWKSLFLHILRILEAYAKKSGKNVTNILDARYRQVPSFGRDTIRRFSSNVSELKCLAARDYEDLLQ
ncbi:hypothetical protein FIBSPDRAFT_905925, partial [Athelia psychrophila]